MRQYTCYYFQKGIVNLTKTKKADLKTILSPLLVEYYEKYKSTTDAAAVLSALSEENVTLASGIECGIGDDAKGISAQEV